MNIPPRKLRTSKPLRELAHNLLWGMWNVDILVSSSSPRITPRFNEPLAIVMNLRSDTSIPGEDDTETTLETGGIRVLTSKKERPKPQHRTPTPSDTKAEPVKIEREHEKSLYGIFGVHTITPGKGFAPMMMRNAHSALLIFTPAKRWEPPNDIISETMKELSEMKLFCPPLLATMIREATRNAETPSEQEDKQDTDKQTEEKDKNKDPAQALPTPPLPFATNTNRSH
jgi:hypothetical protein